MNIYVVLVKKLMKSLVLTRQSDSDSMTCADPALPTPGWSRLEEDHLVRVCYCSCSKRLNDSEPGASVPAVLRAGCKNPLQQRVPSWVIMGFIQVFVMSSIQSHDRKHSRRDVITYLINHPAGSDLSYIISFLFTKSLILFPGLTLIIMFI